MFLQSDLPHRKAPVLVTAEVEIAINAVFFVKNKAFFQ